MNHKLFAPALLVAAFGLTACAEATAPASVDAVAARTGGTTERIVGFRTTPEPLAAGGYCDTDAGSIEPNGTWVTENEAGVLVMHLLHEHCTIRVQSPGRR